MKIIFLIRDLFYGGAERQLVTLAKGLNERGHSVRVIVFYPNGFLEKDLNEVGIPVLSLNKRGRWDIFGLFTKLFKMIKQEKPDFLHGYLGVPNILLILLKPFFPKVPVIWGVRSSNLDRNSFLLQLVYKIECKLSRYADLIIANSIAGKDYAVKHGFPYNKTVVIHNGIDIIRFGFSKAARSQVRKEWNIDENHTLIGLIGRLDPMKDHPTFLKAASILCKIKEDIVFLCVGDGPQSYSDELKNLANEFGIQKHIIWVRGRDDMPSVYSALDLVVSSSYGEGFPNVIAEAMSCGVPCVATDVGDTATIIGRGRNCVPPRDPEGLAESIIYMLNNKSSRCSYREKIIDNYSVQRMIDKTEGILLKGWQY